MIAPTSPAARAPMKIAAVATNPQLAGVAEWWEKLGSSGSGAVGAALGIVAGRGLQGGTWATVTRVVGFGLAGAALGQGAEKVGWVADTPALVATVAFVGTFFLTGKD